MSKTIAQVLAIAQAQLAIVSESPSIDSQYLLAAVLQKPLSFLRAYSEEVVSDLQQKQLSTFVVRRMQGEPVAYITQQQGFWKQLLLTTPATLIPRPETELLIEAVLSECGQDINTLLDLGTGTGAIALALSQERTQWQIYASDISIDALAVAQKNAQQLQCTNLEFRQGSWCEPWQDKAGEFDMIVSNPPYIREHDPHLECGDVAFEPRLALVAGSDGLSAIRIITETAVSILKKGGWLFIEHGFDQGHAVRELFRSNGYEHIETLKDLSGHERVCKGQWN